MVSNSERITIGPHSGVRISFDPDDLEPLEIFDAESGTRIGSLDVNDDGLVTGADIQPHLQRKGIATAVICYLVENYQMDFYFWIPDGQTYVDARHLSEEGAEWANFLVREGLASWVGNEVYSDDEAF